MDEPEICISCGTYIEPDGDRWRAVRWSRWRTIVAALLRALGYRTDRHTCRNGRGQLRQHRPTREPCAFCGALVAQCGDGAWIDERLNDRCPSPLAGDWHIPRCPNLKLAAWPCTCPPRELGRHRPIEVN